MVTPTQRHSNWLIFLTIIFVVISLALVKICGIQFVSPFANFIFFVVICFGLWAGWQCDRKSP